MQRNPRLAGTAAGAETAVWVDLRSSQTNIYGSTGWRWRRHALVTIFRAALIVLTCLLLGGCNTRTPDRWDVPAGYVGWIVAQYEDPSCGPLPIEHGYKVLKLNARGRVCTSEKQEAGDAFDKFFYLDADGHSSEIDQGKFVWGGVYYANTKRSFQFVGSEDAYHASPDNSQILDQRCAANPKC